MALHIYVDNPFIWINFKGVDDDRNRVVFMSDMQPAVNFPGIPVHVGKADTYTTEKGKAHRDISKLSRYSTIKEFSSTLQSYIDSYGDLDMDNGKEYRAALFIGSESCSSDKSWLNRTHKLIALRYAPGSSIGSAQASLGTIKFSNSGIPTVNASPFKCRNYMSDVLSVMGNGRLIPLC